MKKLARERFFVDFVNNEIVATEATLKKAGKIGTPEYNELLNLKENHPTFSIKTKEIRKNENKKTYGDLTFEKMEEYIMTQPDSEKNLVKFEMVKKVAKAKNSLYPLTKSWFLKTFADYKNEISANELMKEETKELENEVMNELSEIKVVA